MAYSPPLISVEEEGEMANGKCYDLSGRQIANRKLHRGIYIQNGRKIVVR